MCSVCAYVRTFVCLHVLTFGTKGHVLQSWIVPHESHLLLLWLQNTVQYHIPRHLLLHTCKCSRKRLQYIQIAYQKANILIKSFMCISCAIPIIVCVMERHQSNVEMIYIIYLLSIYHLLPSVSFWHSWATCLDSGCGWWHYKLWEKETHKTQLNYFLSLSSHSHCPPI